MSITWASLGGSVVKNLRVNAGDAGDMGLIPELERPPLEEEMTTHSSIIAWKSPWTVWQAGVHGVVKSWTRLSD